MPFFDCYWSLRYAFAALVAVFGVLVFVRLIVPDVPSKLVTGDMAIAVPLGAVLLAASVLLARGAGPARHRKELRERVIAGDEDAMPAAELHRRQPPRALQMRTLALFWSARTPDRVYAAFFPLLLGVAVLFFSLTIFIPFVLYLLIGVQSSITQLGLGANVVISLLLPFSLYILYWSVPAALGERPGVEVTPEGIAATSLWGWREVVGWEDARLFEVEVVGGRGFHLYERHMGYSLYGKDAVARRRTSYDPPLNPRLPMGYFRPETRNAQTVAAVMNALAWRVQERAGLLPHTFTPSLMVATADSTNDHNGEREALNQL